MSVPSLKQLGVVSQLAYFPVDFDAALRHWTQVVGVGPFFLLNDVRLEDMRYRGKPTDAVFSMALGYWGDMQIELIRCESDAPSLYRGEYAVRDSLHHVCVFVDDMTAARAACAKAGAEVLMEGKVGNDGEVIYVDPGPGPGHVIEFLRPMSDSGGLFAMMRDAACTWDGTDPVRILG